MQLKYFTLKIVLVLVVLAACAQLSFARASNRSRQRSNIESNSIQRHAHHNDMYGRHTRALKLVRLQNRTVTCNDGSQAGFYLRKSQGSRRWIVYLDGGWHCYDEKSCRQRWMKDRVLMTSASWKETKHEGGILSSDPNENPYWYNANHVFVPYCSSDSWSGALVNPQSRDGLRFMGSLIIRQVIEELIPLGLGHSQGTDLLIAGSSAGGLGVMLNLDRIKHMLQVEKNLNVEVRGVCDSAWFVEQAPYIASAENASEAVKQGYKMWNAALPAACVAEYPDEPWQCFFGHRLYNTLKAPLFVFQWFFDEAQMSADNVGVPKDPEQWNYIHQTGLALRSSLDNVTAVFAPSCVAHSVLAKRDWLDIKIDDISVSDALRCWENSVSREKNIKRRAPKRSKEEREERKRKRMEQKDKRRRKQLQKEREEQRRRRCEKRKKRQGRRLDCQKRHQGGSGGGGGARLANKSGISPKIIDRPQRNNKNRKQNGTHHTNHHRHERNNNNNNNNQRRRIQYNYNRPEDVVNSDDDDDNYDEPTALRQSVPTINEPKKCSLRLVERCSWPQCNLSCPTLVNPHTGEEMKFLEVLVSFGLNKTDAARAFGVDLQTLNNMEQSELVNLLTQQVS